MFRTARRLKGHQQQQGSARKQQGSARKQQGSARKQQQQQQHQRPAMSGVTEDIRSFLRRLFWCVAVRRSAGGNGSRTRLDLPSFFSFFPLFFPVASAASGPVCPRFFSLFFPRQEEWREAHQARFALVFSLFFHVRRSGVSRIRPGLPLFFSLFFHVRRSAGGRTRPGLPLFFFLFFHVRRSAGGDLPSFFSLFSTSGGVGRRRQLCRVGGPSGDCSLSLWGVLLRGRMEIQGASQACFFFKRLHHLAA